MKLLLRRLDRLGRHATRLERDINAMAEAFAVFVQLWFAHTPSIGENEKDAARREAWNQYQKFVEMWQPRWLEGTGSLMIWCRTP